MRPGKTSIARRLAENDFESNYAPTIICTFHRTIHVEGVLFDLEIVDTAGQVGALDWVEFGIWPSISCRVFFC